MIIGAKKAIQAYKAKNVTVQSIGYSQPTNINPFPVLLSKARAQAVIDYIKSLKLVAKYKGVGAGNAPYNDKSARYVEITISWTV